MRKRRWFHVLTGLLLLLSALVNVPVSAHNAQILAVDEHAEYVPGEVVVAVDPAKFSSPTTLSSQVSALAREIQAQVLEVSSGGLARLGIPMDADPYQVAEQLKRYPGVLFAEPNYIYKLVDPDFYQPQGYVIQSEYVLRHVTPGPETEGKDLVAIPIEVLQSMRRRVGSRIQAVYPNDPYLWSNWGWSEVSADLVSNNTTVSANVCVIDTGVDYLHKDLVTKIIKGRDYIEDDLDPMDDNGHGTHVAGIIAAIPNNKQGIAGVSTGKIVAVRALDAQGYGTTIDVADAIQYCANRTDVRIINLSLGGAASAAIQSAVNYAVNAKGKLIVAAAGNDDASEKVYPAGYAEDYPNKVLAVAAAGLIEGTELNYSCKATYSNYGSWVSVVAPGTAIYSTTPWDRPNYLGLKTRYDSLSGTSMASAFVAAAAARYWGYKPTKTNAQVGAAVAASGDSVNADGDCWPIEMDGKHKVNVAALLDRGGLSAHIYNAYTGLPLVGAMLSAYQGITLRGSALVTPTITKEPQDLDPTRIYMSFGASADVINLPAGSSYTAKVSLSGYTATPQNAFQHSSFSGQILAGGWGYTGVAAVPPKSTNFALVLGWRRWTPVGDYFPAEGDIHDLDLNLWLPNVPNPKDPSQPAPFIVGEEGNSFGYLEGDPIGSMVVFPFARLIREGGFTDAKFIEVIAIRSRLAHGALPTNAALPYYPGDYVAMVTDYGQTIDHDGDGCGDNYGEGYDPNYEPGSECDGGKTFGIPLLGAYYVPHLYIWKDGVIKYLVKFNHDGQPVEPGDPCNAPWWKAVQISSGSSVTYTALNVCGDVGTGGIQPYSASGFNGRMGIADK